MLFAFSALPFAVAHAQSTSATLSGTVTDQNGAAIPGATITILNTATSLQRQATTNDEGYFVVPLLSPGTYTVSARRDGFAPLDIHVTLNVGDQKALQIQLKAGDVNATVTVDSSAELVRTDSAVATVVDRQFVANIPLNGRSFQSLINLTPGVVVPIGAPAFGGEIGGQFSVNGQRASSNAFMVDGVSANVGSSAVQNPGPQTGGNLPGLTTLGTTQSLVSVDAMQEFKVQTSGYAAEYGRQPGGQISIQTRSGTSQFHGNLFDYLRNDVFDANNWFLNARRQPKPPLRQNDFGGTFSGPLFLPRFGEGGGRWYNGRDKTFFFFSYEGLRLRQPKFALTNVPTRCLRGLGSCQAGQSAAAVGIQPFLKSLPLPNGRDLGNGFAEFASGYSDPSSLNATSIRIDHAISSKVNVFGRYNYSPSSTDARSTFNLSSISGSEAVIATITLGANVIFTARSANEFRFNYSRNDARTNTRPDPFGGSERLDGSLICLPQYCKPQSAGNVQFVLPGVSAISMGVASSIGYQRQFNVVDGFTYTKGTHHLKFGGDYRQLLPERASFVYRVSASFTTFNGVLTGVASSAVARASVPTQPVYTSFSAYAQDTWNVSQRLVLDVGVRWELNPAPHLAGSDQELAVTQVRDLSTMKFAPSGTPLWKTTYGNFAPRAGVAYFLSRDAGRETILRGGFGVFYDSGNDMGSVQVVFHPFTVAKNFTNVVFPLSPALFAPPTVPGSLAPPVPATIFIDPTLKLPYTLQWNVALERSLGREQALTVSYVGAVGRRLLQSRNVSLQLINPNFTSGTVVTNLATSDYHALQAQFRRRLSRGLQALVSYTWSHSIDEDSRSFGSVAGISAQRGNSEFDFRHVFGAALTYEIPVRERKGLGYQLLRGWAADANFHAQSAYPFDIVSSTLIDPVDGSRIAIRPNVISGVPFYLKDPTAPGSRVVNNIAPTASQVAAAGCGPVSASTPAKGAFCTPLPGKQGNLGRNVLRGFPAWQLDFALRRRIKLSEKTALQFRAEAFNIFNHPNFAAISTSLSAANFGQATNTVDQTLNGINALYQIGGARSMQFALKFEF
ncbi:MAG TPA: TonB-dependent receptor [Blastocatellia bacterium]|nr:TonB-dependent receptor [Blastocatellia bacterium]